MKLRIDQKQLADAARRAHRRLPANPAIPVMAGLVLEASPEGAVSLSGFDYETATRATLDAETLEPGKAVVSARLLADVAASMPAGPVDMVADEQSLTLSTPGNHFALPIMNGSDYPALPEPPIESGTVDGAAFAAAVTNTAVAALAQKDAVGQVEGMGGVHIVADADKLTLAATDRYRLVLRTIPWTPGDSGSGAMLLPAPDLAVTAKTLAAGTVRLAFPGPGQGVAAISGAGLRVISRTIAGAFPRFEQHFPGTENASGSVILHAADLVDAVKRAALVNDNDKKPIRIEFGDGTATVHGGGSGAVGSSQIGADTDGASGFAIAFNPGYLASLVDPVNVPVRMWLYTPTKPVLIEPINDDAGDGYRAVLMPVRLT